LKIHNGIIFEGQPLQIRKWADGIDFNPAITDEAEVGNVVDRHAPAEFFDKIKKGLFTFSAKDVIKQTCPKDFIRADQRVDSSANYRNVEIVSGPGGELLGISPLISDDGETEDVGRFFFDSSDEFLFFGKRLDIFAELPEDDFVSRIFENGSDMRQAVIEADLRAGVGIDKKYFHSLWRALSSIIRLIISSRSIFSQLKIVFTWTTLQEVFPQALQRRIKRGLLEPVKIVMVGIASAADMCWQAES